MSLPPTTVATIGTPVYTDPNGRRWRIGFDTSSSPPAPIFVPVTTWGYAKGLFASWGDVRRAALKWGEAKQL